MKRSLLGLLLFVRLSAFAGVSLDGEVGYRRDHLRWSISGNGADVLSELTYRNLDIVEGRAEAESRFFCWLLRARGATGYIFGGTDQDSDFRRSGRTLEFSRSTSRVGGMSNDISLDLGRRISIGPLAATTRYGIEWHHLYVRSFDGFRHIPPPTRRLTAHVDSGYHAHWVAAFAALQLHCIFPTDQLWFEGALHAGGYIGRGNWRLRDMHFNHAAPAYAFTLEGSWRHRLCGPLWAIARLGGGYWLTESGYNSGGGAFREAQWSSIHTSLGLVIAI